MDLRNYFESQKGFGVLATADKDGNVDAAVYARPHVMEDGSLAFIMKDRLTHHNLQSNPRAAYLFKQDGPGYKGKRFFLKKIKETEDSETIESLRRKFYPTRNEEAGAKEFAVFFQIEKELPLIGSGEKED
ncbi:Pyridoxamine 5'-phosphate oxidase [Desulfacinum infernum DSM 9756]|uniref:Pyridoxamine 5'-phosphate oxidase n=1 Tax=Desulfacinum infernum DSM 9756 TaxID=1121391 RepID=A0A1M5FW21_9BACT|nr:pyridoxamine 5'-phosphate oxidase family protein [Desulfacinum infernum]SHF95392.1 Pyridoxamine 5'-phosphate oxidase [Desulfacinum infernum DSM 9756]